MALCASWRWRCGGCGALRCPICSTGVPLSPATSSLSCVTGPQVYDSCNGNGTYCSLVTGQERREVPFARHVSCTVEMANIDEPVDVRTNFSVACQPQSQIVADWHPCDLNARWANLIGNR